MITKLKILVLLAVLAGGMAGPAMATGSLWDDFESYGFGTSLSSQGGWGGDAEVTVSSNVYGDVTKLGAFPLSTVVSNSLPAGANGKVWNECQMVEAARMDPSSLPLVNPSNVVMVGVTTDGFAVVYNTASNGWDVCSNDARGTIVSGVASGTWAQVTVCDDFSSHQAALFLNGRLLRQKLPFINTNLNSVLGVRFRSGTDSTGYVDNVYVSNSIPPSLTNLTVTSTNDINGDGMPDAREINLFGALAKMVPADYATITDALAAASAGDRIGVSNATYAVPVALSNGITLFGVTNDVNATNLTIQGTMTVGTGTIMNAFGLFTVTGQVTVAAGGVLTISNTTASFGGLTIGGGGLLQMVNGSLVVGNYTNSGTFTLSLITNMVSSAGNGTITPYGTSTMISTWSNVVYTLQATDIGYVVGSLTKNSADVGAALVGAGGKTATYTNLASNITNNQTIVAAFVYNGIRYVPGDYGTITGALAVAQANDRIVVGDGSYAESVVVSNTITLTGVNVTGVTGLTVLSNKTAVLDGFTTFAVNNLVIQSGGTLQVSNTTLTANGLTLNGTFALNSSWGQTITPSALNFADDFESYPTNMALAWCGGAGWGASDVGSVIQGLVYTNGGSQAAKVASGSTLSNVVDGLLAQSNVWTDVFLQDTAVKYAEGSYPTTNAGRAVSLFVNTNNHVVIWNSNAWDECTQNVVGSNAPTVSTGQWVRVTVYEDFAAQKVALFLNGQLVREQVPFVSHVPSYKGFSLRSGEGAAYLDDIKVWTNMPASLTNEPAALSDLDHDGVADAVEIALYGNTLQCPPQGSVFKIR